MVGFQVGLLVLWFLVMPRAAGFVGLSSFMLDLIWMFVLCVVLWIVGGLLSLCFLCLGRKLSYSRIEVG